MPIAAKRIDQKRHHSRALSISRACKAPAYVLSRFIVPLMRHVPRFQMCLDTLAGGWQFRV